MNLDGDDVGTDDQHGRVGHSDCVHGSLCGTHRTRGSQRRSRDDTRRHVRSRDLYTIYVHHGAIVAHKVHRKRAVSGGRHERESCVEDNLVQRRLRLLVAVSEADRRQPRLPAAIVERRVYPRAVAESGGDVVILPRGCRADDDLNCGGGTVGGCRAHAHDQQQ